MENILARDQRTTSHRVLDRTTSLRFHALPSTTTLSSEKTKYQQDATKATTNRTKPTYALRYLLYNSHFTSSTTFNDDRGFTLTTCLWFLLINFFVLLVQGAPMTLEEKRLTTPPKWVNPCGLASEDFVGDLDVVQLPDEQLIQQIVLQAKQALYHLERFRDRYLEDTFGSDLRSLNSPQFNLHYDWLPGWKEIPKHLGEMLDQDYLNNRDLDQVLLNAYEHMQTFAVGIEQIVWDQEDYKLRFRDEFKDAEFKLRGVLCELQVALVERGLTPRPDVTRDIMSSEFRKRESRTQTELRDWLIFRDYMNALEYLIQVFDHLAQRLRSEQS